MLDRTDRSLVAVWWWTIDRWLLASAILLMAIGALLVMAAGPAVAMLINLPSQHFGLRQGTFLLPAALVMLGASFLEPRPIRVLALIGLIGSVTLMAAAVAMGDEIKGASRWISIGGWTLQPSEFAKPFFAVVSAWLLALWREGNDFPGWACSTLIMAVLAGLLAIQPDVGMTAMIVMTWAFQMFLAGLPMIHVAGIMTMAPLGLLAAYFSLDHVRVRIETFMEGGAWQVEQARHSFANGGLFGVGPGDGTVKHHLPDAHSDFIFAVAAEEYGALACLTLLALYAFIVLRGFARAMSDEGLFSLIAVCGLVMQFGAQAAIHMASSVDLIPTKGMTLPLVSYGGSSLVASCMAMGIILALTRRRSPQTLLAMGRTREALQ